MHYLVWCIWRVFASENPRSFSQSPIEMSCVSLPDLLFLGPRSSLWVNSHGFTWSNVAHSLVCPSTRRWSSPLVVASRSCKRASTAKTYHGKMSEKCTVPTPKVMIDSILRGQVKLLKLDQTACCVWPCMRWDRCGSQQACLLLVPNRPH